MKIKYRFYILVLKMLWNITTILHNIRDAQTGCHSSWSYDLELNREKDQLIDNIERGFQ